MRQKIVQHNLIEMNKNEIKQYLKNKLSIEINTSGNWATIVLRLEGEIIAQSRSTQLG